MKPAYLLLVRKDGPGQPDFLARLARRTGLALGFSKSGIAAFVSPHWRCVPFGNQGCLVGTVFPRHGPARPLDRFDAHEATSIVGTRGDSLIRDFWGGYVAAIASAGSTRVLRDPSATFACYYARRGRLAAFASDAEILVDCGFVPVEFDWRGLSADLFTAGVPRPATALEGISELLAGFSLEVGNGISAQQPCWSPWDHVVDGQAAPSDPVAERLARTVRHCVQSLAAMREPLLLSVSGGLDSSIVAACLAGTKAETTCITLFGQDAGSDERPFARALCEYLGLDLVECPYRLDQVDIAQPLGAHLPRPRDRAQALSYEHQQIATAAATGAKAFITGNGGDSVFNYSQSAAPVADRYLSEGLGRGALESLLDVCRQTGCSLSDAATGAWRIVRRPASYSVRPNPLFLHPDLIADMAVASPPSHPWLDAPRRALPGKAAHIASILRVQQSLEPGRSAILPVLNPLMSQPVLELCLKVPSWEWRSGGRDRSLARRAFAGDLPPAILRRRVKGSPGHFAGQVLERDRARIRERLLGGALASQRMIDRGALEAVLTNGRPCTDEQRVRILELVAVEAWLESWDARRTSKVDSRSAGDVLE